jgi:hypothetical protein
MSSIDDLDSMTRFLSSSLEQTPLSSLSSASSYSSLVNCDDTIGTDIDHSSISIDAHQQVVHQHYDNINKRTSHSMLLSRHMNKLCSILEQSIDIHGQGNFPTLNIVCKDLLVELRQAFHANRIDIRDIRLNGGNTNISNTYTYITCIPIGAASYVLTHDKSFAYADMDFVFGCDLSSESTWTQIKNIVCQCLSQRMPGNSFSSIIIQTAYVEKIVRIVNPANQDSWALISLCNHHGQNIELKFVDRMKRQFQFSVDSFQIILDPLLTYYEQQPNVKQTCELTKKPCQQGKLSTIDTCSSCIYSRKK